MAEKYVIESAKKSGDLEKTYEKVKSHMKEYGFSTATNLKLDVVKKAMDEAKKGADFLAEYDWAKDTLIGQLVCDVKGKMRSVIGRTEIKTVEELEKFKAIASNKALHKNFAEIHH